MCLDECQVLDKNQIFFSFFLKDSQQPFMYSPRLQDCEKQQVVRIRTCTGHRIIQIICFTLMTNSGTNSHTALFTRQVLAADLVGQHGVSLQVYTSQLPSQLWFRVRT